MLIDDSPMLRDSSLNWADIVADAAIHVAAVRGLSGLSTAALARHMNMTSPALLHRFGSTSGVLQAAIGALTRRWDYWIHRVEGTDLHDPVTALHGQITRLIPATEREIDDIRAWSAIRAFALHAGESHSELAEIARRSDAAERLRVRHCLGRYLGTPPPDSTVEILAACAAGLRERVLDPELPLHPDAAREALSIVVDRVVVQPTSADARIVSS